MSNCEEIVTWLKNFFTAKDDECNYKVTASNYNPTISGTVTITVTVTDGNGDAVSGHSFKLDADGTEVTLTTNSSGVATHSYSCSTWGLHTFSVGEASVQINVNGWKQIYTSSDNKIIVYANENTGLVKLTVNKTINYSQSNVVLPTGTISETYRPPYTVKHIIWDDGPNGQALGQFEFNNDGSVSYYGIYEDQSQDPGYEEVSTVITYAY